MTHILVVEDESIIRNALKRLLERHGHQVDCAESVTEAIPLLKHDYDLIISDLRLPGGTGTDLIEQTQAPVLIMTSYASLRSAVDAMKQGAVDYIAKPFDHDEMLATVDEILARKASGQGAPAVTASEHAPVDADTGTRKGEMIGASQPMLELQRRIEKIAKTDATVLIQGESGTGKELAARAIHERSGRAAAPMISVNCAAIPETLIESELFGHEKGAFTGAVATHSGLIEAADGGTLFLDEIGELPLEAQARLLRVLQEGEIRKVGSVAPRKVDIRLVAATHRNLKELTRQGKFREDLYYRLYIMEIRMPALRERGADILELAERFLQRACKRLECGPLAFSSATRQALLHYTWPGNVRELENTVERAAILCEGTLIESEHLGLDLDPQHATASPVTPQEASRYASQPPLGQPASQPSLSLEDYFQRFVLENQHKMTETELARRLGVSRKCLWERRQKLGIPRPGRSAN